MSRPSFKWSLKQIASAANGKLAGNDMSVCGLSTDTRRIENGNVFVALSGPNFDGHDFVTNAVDAGASAVIVSRRVDVACPQIIVTDTQSALGEIASKWRDQFDIPLIAVTGSNGKTTVKEMLTAIFSVDNKVLATEGNLNNEIGVPLTLLRLSAEHEYAVIEIGANHPGEIAYLSRLAKPTVAVITNAGSAHLEGFGDLQGVADAKGEIYSGLTDNGVAIVNADDSFAQTWFDLCTSHKILSFGLSANADVNANWKAGASESEINVRTADNQFNISLPLLGKHNVMNALAAVAVASAAGITPASIRPGLENLKPVSGRLQLKHGKSDSRVIDDTYNANPASFSAALDVLSVYPGEHYLALGDMAELGEGTQQLHHDAGVQARDTGVHKLFTVGKLAKHAAQGFGEQAKSFSDQPAMISAINDELSSDVTLLVKGSRLMQMEKVVNALTINGENA